MHQNSAKYVSLLHLLPDDIVFDVGANAGEVTRALAGVARHVYAFEPNPELANRFSDLPSNVTLVQKAVSDKVGETQFFVDARENHGAVASSLMPLSGMEGHTRTIPVAVTTLDAFCDEIKETPDLIKIDVEGYEPQVIAGAHQIISRRRPIIIFELWESHWERYQPFIDFLKPYYRLVRVSDGAEATAYYSTHAAEGVDDILCIPYEPRRR